MRLDVGSGQGDQEVMEMAKHLQDLLCFAVEAEKKNALRDEPQLSVSASCCSPDIQCVLTQSSEF